MRKGLAICAGLLILGTISGNGAAQAQAIYAGPGYAGPGPFEPSAVLPPYEIMSIVRSTGLAPLTRPMRRGSYYVLVAVDRVGRQMRVVVDAQLGDIVNMRPAVAAGPFSPGAVPLPDTASAPYGARAGTDSFSNSSANPPPPRPVPSARTTTASQAAPPVTGVSAPNSASPGSGAPTVTASNTSPPSAVAPQTRLATVAPALPPPPPLPRPRPKLALNQAPAPAPAAAAPTPPAGAAASQAAPDAAQIE